MSSQQHNEKSPSDMKTVPMSEFLHHAGPEGRRAIVNIANTARTIYKEYAAENPAETAYDNIQLRGKKRARSDRVKTEATPMTNNMDNIRKIGRLMERVEALEAENRALKRKNSELEDKQAEKQAFKRKNTEFEDKQAKMRKLLEDE
ncbi:hypothetical protein IL306_010807 [Fusarium sp. DS 682]|nr:hypothetical protein IL306_010807 [Fusarium sp. DS 682]